MNRVLSNQGWVAQQYKTPSNLNARILLHQRFGTNPNPWMLWVFERLQLQPALKVLEVGGGPGGLWQENRYRLPKDLQVVFTDQSPGMLAQASATLGDLPHFSFSVSDAQALPFADASFDVVVANHMLYHVPDRNLALSEFRRVLCANGRLFAATNDRSHMQELRNLAENFMPGTTKAIDIHERFPFDVAARELSEHFGQVQLHRYHNNLAVTDADILADYMLSGISVNLPEVAIAPFRKWLRARIDAQGAIVITSASGLFEATTAT